MAICGRCGRDNPSEGRVCFDCGTPLSPTPSAASAAGAASPPAGNLASGATNRGALSGTVLGLPTPFRPPAEAASEGPATLRGAAAPRETPTDAAPRPEPRSLNLRSTALGLGAPVRVPEPPSAAPRREFSGTLLGHSAPTTTVVPGPGSPPTAAPRTAAASSPPDGLSPVRTMMGVARPGIAPDPLRKAAGPPKAAPPTRSTGPEPGPEAVAGLPRRGSGMRTWGVLAAVLVALAASAFAVFELRGSGRALVVTNFEDLDGKTDALAVECRGCPDGARLRLGEATFAVEGGRARVTVPKLALGDTPLTFVLESADSHESLTTVVPVRFRVHASWRRDGGRLRGEVEVRAVDGARIEIDGRPIPLLGGVARHTFAVDAETTGESDGTEKLERILPVRVTVDGRALAASAVLVGRVPPLRLLTPAPHHRLVGRTVTVSGRTEPLATVRVAEQETTADERGDFSLLVPVPPSTTALRIMATAPGTLPRALDLPLGEPTSETRASERTVRGRIVEIRASGGRTTLVLETKECADPPCLLRVVHGESVPLTRGQLATATGTESPGPPPTLRAARLAPL